MSLLRGTDISVPESLSLTAGILKGAAILLGESTSRSCWQRVLLFPVSLGSRDGDRQGKIGFVCDASGSGMCVLPSSLQTGCFEVSLRPVLQKDLGFCSLLHAVPGGKAEAMRPLPTRWQWDSLSQAAALGTAGVCAMRYQAPEGVPGASRVCRVCACGGTPCTCIRFCPIKNCWTKSQSPSVSLDVGYWCGLPWSLWVLMIPLWIFEW